jgi:phage/plasmid-like protein (TIGR03299 family)
MVTTREVPWMKLGKLVDEPMTAKEAAELGGLNFQVSKRPVYFTNAAGEFVEIPDRRAIVRDDTNDHLGIMASDYQMLQYGEAFDFMDVINPTYVAAGALKGGKQGFMVVKAPETINVIDGEDPHELFMILRTSHDGSRAIEVSVQALRNRCMNQLALRSFTSGVEHRWAIKHTTTMHQKLSDAKTSLVKLDAYAKTYEENAMKLATTSVSDEKAKHVLEMVLPNRPRRENQIEHIISSWHTAETVGFDYTGWGLVNAVSEYFDWGRTGGSPESRFIGALQGQTFKAVNGVAQVLLDA